MVKVIIKMKTPKVPQSAMNLSFSIFLKRMSGSSSREIKMTIKI